MGSGRDKRKKAKGHTPGLGADKTAKRTDKNAEKESRRLERKAKGGEGDIDALLAKFKLEDEAQSTVRIEENCIAPTPRVYATFIPLNEKEIIMFGGEWLDSERDKMYVYADVYILHTDKLTWRRVISPRGPLPRASHQAAITSNRTYMYVFGGEFTSVNQEKFKHYGDLWRLDLKSWHWEQLPSKGGPSARSGHRMVLHKGQLLLFGGFYDAGKETKFYNDLWVFDVEAFKWECLGPKPGTNWPAPRGGCQLALPPDGGTLYMIGGYSVRQNTSDSTSSEQQGPKKKKGGSGDGDGEACGVVHDDVWALDLKSWEWERVKKAGMAPTARTSFGLVTHKGRAVLFGGVYDREGAGDKLYSELFNEAYMFNFASRRWFPLAIRPTTSISTQRQSEKTEGGEAVESENDHGQLPPGVSPEMHAALMKRTADKNSPLVRAATRIQAAYRGYVVRSAYRAYRLGGNVSELLYSPATYGIDLSSTDTIKPRARSAPMLAVLRNTMWMWGGMVEIGHTDIVLDDLWSLDLNKLDGWQCVKENSVGEEAFKELSDEDSEDQGWETE